jgi:hypothetical protein
MISGASVEKVYLAQGKTDLRKSIDGLAALVREEFDLDPFSPCLFVFCNRSRDKLKIYNGIIMVFGCIIDDWRKGNSTGPQMNNPFP